MSCRLDEDETNFGLVYYVSCTQLQLYSHFAKKSKPTDKFTLYYPPYLRFWVYTNAYYEEYLPIFKGVFFLTSCLLQMHQLGPISRNIYRCTLKHLQRTGFWKQGEEISQNEQLFLKTSNFVLLPPCFQFYSTIVRRTMHHDISSTGFQPVELKTSATDAAHE